ncbi:MAG: FAD-binding oxidoreductase [Candidatus Hermodarchaeota archaeon]
MKRVIDATRWGIETTPSHVRFTDSLRKFILDQLGMDLQTTEKKYSQKRSLEDIKIKTQLPEEFVTKIKQEFPSTQVSNDLQSRIKNSIGKSYLELLQARLADISSLVELVVYPRTHTDVVKLICLANEYKIPISPVGGGTSMTLGIQAPSGSIAINLSQMNKVLMINKDSLYITTQVGIFGPELERILNHENLTLGHFPQSFEYSTVGGWVVTRGAGQNSTLYGKIEDMIMGMKFVTGYGETLTIRSAPAKAAGPDLNQLIAGSEGAFGILTEVTLRVAKLPQKIKLVGFFFHNFHEGIIAIKNLVQDGYTPAIIRLYNAEETFSSLRSLDLMKDPPNKSFLIQLVLKYVELRGYTERYRSLAIVAFEGNSDLVKLTRKKTIAYAKKAGGIFLGSTPGKSWIKSRYESPFLRDPIIDHGILLETFETSTTWENIVPLYNAVQKAIKPECPVLWTHSSHFYKNGANLYFHLWAPQEDGNEVEQFLRIKKKVLDTFLSHGGTIGHHHGVGRAFSQWLPLEIGEVGIKILHDIKNSFDPNRIMNPGVFGLK